jgi:hypothetical protein
MSKFSWDNPTMKQICGECYFKDKDPELCHAVEPPMKKPFIPKDTSSCSFLRDSYWQRMSQTQRDDVEALIAERSERYYKKRR